MHYAKMTRQLLLYNSPGLRPIGVSGSFVDNFAVKPILLIAVRGPWVCRGLYSANPRSRFGDPWALFKNFGGHFGAQLFHFWPVPSHLLRFSFHDFFDDFREAWFAVICSDLHVFYSVFWRLGGFELQWVAGCNLDPEMCNSSAWKVWCATRLSCSWVALSCGWVASPFWKHFRVI